MTIEVNFDSRLKEVVKAANSLVFFTGSGISAESGIPTFRGEDGIWKKFKPEELANFNAFICNPDLVWQWYQYRRMIIEKCKPNNGHKAIAEAEKYFKRVAVITQNVDNLHMQAGSKIIYELHGNITRNYCIDCNENFEISNNISASETVPKCEKCNGLIRPDVVWFGESLPQDVWSKAEIAAETADICFVIGSSGLVYPAAQIPINAKSFGALLIEINTEETPLTSKADYFYKGKAGEILPALITEIKKIKV